MTSTRLPCLLVAAANLLLATPVLRLSNTVVYPQSGQQSGVLQVYNAGDGTLTPGVSVPPGTSWVIASIGSACPPAIYQSCVTIQFQFDTSSLSAGTNEVTVIVYSPGAADSPQTVSVIFQQQGNEAIALDAFQGVNSADISIYAGTSHNCPAYAILGCPPAMNISTQDGGAWFTIISYGEGTLAYPFFSYVHLTPPPTMGFGGYQGSVAITGGDFSSIPVALNLYPRPLAWPSPSNINLTLAQGSSPLAYPFVPAIALDSAGAIPALTAAASGPGIAASVVGGMAHLSIDPGNLIPGSYSGTVTIGCPAADCPVIVPVSFNMVSPGPPGIRLIVDNVTFNSAAFAPGEILAVQGTQLSTQPPAFAGPAPLPTLLGGVSVLMDGVAAPLYYSSATQIAFELPADASVWPFKIQLVRDGQTGGPIVLSVQSHAPQIAAVTDTAYNPIDGFHPAKAGDTLIVWAIGLGATTPAVPSGASSPLNPLAQTTMIPSVEFAQGILAQPTFAGLAPGTVGLYQVNVTIPASVPTGNLSVKIRYPDAVSNAFPIAIQ